MSNNKAQRTDWIKDYSNNNFAPKTLYDSVYITDSQEEKTVKTLIEELQSTINSLQGKIDELTWKKKIIFIDCETKKINQLTSQNLTAEEFSDENDKIQIYPQDHCEYYIYWENKNEDNIILNINGIKDTMVEAWLKINEKENVGIIIENFLPFERANYIDVDYYKLPYEFSFKDGYYNMMAVVREDV